MTGTALSTSTATVLLRWCLHRCRLGLNCGLLLVFFVSHVAAYYAARSRAYYPMTTSNMASHSANCRAFKAPFCTRNLRRPRNTQKHRNDTKTSFHENSFYLKFTD